MLSLYLGNPMDPPDVLGMDSNAAKPTKLPNRVKSKQSLDLVELGCSDLFFFRFTTSLFCSAYLCFPFWSFLLQLLCQNNLLLDLLNQLFFLRVRTISLLHCITKANFLKFCPMACSQNHFTTLCWMTIMIWKWRAWRSSLLRLPHTWVCASDLGKALVQVTALAKSRSLTLEMIVSALHHLPPLPRHPTPSQWSHLCLTPLPSWIWCRRRAPIEPCQTPCTLLQ